MHAAQIILILILLLILILILILLLILILILILLIIIILILSRFLGTPQTIFDSGYINCLGGGVGHIKAGPTLFNIGGGVGGLILGGGQRIKPRPKARPGEVTTMCFCYYLPWQVPYAAVGASRTEAQPQRSVQHKGQCLLKIWQFLHPGRWSYGQHL